MSTDAVTEAPAGVTWLDGALARGERTRVVIDWPRVFATLLLAVPLLIGWLAGKAVTAALYAWAAAGEGYTRGRGPAHLTSVRPASP